jgi:hypothetical protein
MQWLSPVAELVEEYREQMDSFFGKDGEIFNAPYGAGYWLCGVEYDEENGWLAYEFDEQAESPREMDHELAIAVWRRQFTDRLPDRYYRIDKDAISTTFNHILARWGQEGLKDLDLPRADEAIQWTLLGEHRYG